MNDTNQPDDSTTPNLRKLFQRLGAVIPDGKKPAMTILPELSAADALALLDKHDFSHLPVVVGEEVLGLFSYRSFSRAVAEYARLHKKSNKFEPHAWAVADCMDCDPMIARASDDLHRWFNATSPRDAVLVWGKRVAGGSSFPPAQRPLHIITAFDIQQHLYLLTSLFVLVEEVERALRAVIGMAVDDKKLEELARKCITDCPPDKIPTTLEKMNFSHYYQIVGDGRGWEYFKSYFGGERETTREKLKEFGRLRNVIFHFVRTVNDEERKFLLTTRNWMLQKARQADAREKAENSSARTGPDGNLYRDTETAMRKVGKSGHVRAGEI